MKRSMRMLFSILFVAGTVSAARAQAVVVLVRHAEKVDESAASALTAAGQARARALGAMLKDAGIQAVFSTDYRRTLDTAKPTAEAVSKLIEIYDGDDLAGFAKALRARGNRALVVGHSDTTPELVSLLGGESGPPIASDEYDRIYLLTIYGDGKASTTLLRFPSGVEK
ncbi:MAG TPA: histidine phosphatase family protein [Vicinamibacteria bacterium]|nr:histidine phosphatase family protein [Vicinamibacteria bacterium]